jgi:proline utilization trans-activator
MYSGMAVRLSTCLGLHRALPNASVLSPMEREHRVRLWWTVYVFDRSTCSKLGQPLTIQDADIDVEMPSAEVAGSESQRKLGSPDHLIAYINLAQITGFIMRDIYAPSSKPNGVRFVQNVRSILQRLKKWDVHVPSSLRWRAEGGVPRPVASLQLHFNQCIMLATRPILLHVLKVKDPFGDHCAGTPSAGSWPRLSDTARSLADSCIAAARTSNSILSQLFVENALATCGYFDAHHLFSSTLVLVISAIVSPNSGDSDAVQTAFQLLMVMRDNGNAAAGQYFSRLIKLQWSVSRLFTRATAAAEEANISADAQPHPPSISASPQFPPSASAEFDDYDWSNLLLPHSFYANFDEEQAAAGNITADPLDNPILQAFLEGTDTSLDGNSVF